MKEKTLWHGACNSNRHTKRNNKIKKTLKLKLTKEKKKMTNTNNNDRGIVHHLATKPVVTEGIVHHLATKPVVTEGIVHHI